MSEKTSFEHVKAIFGVGVEPEKYDMETAELLEKAGIIFERYREKASTADFMNEGDIMKMKRTLTAIYCSLSPRLGYYDNEELTTYWQKNLVRVTKRKELYKLKTEKKLTEKMIETLGDDDKDFRDAITTHLYKADFANRLKQIIRACKVMMDSLNGEIIALQVERKHTSQ